MKFGIIGLGRMGASLARHAIEQGHHVVGFNRSREKTQALIDEGLEPAWSVEELVAKLSPPRVILVYVAQGEATQRMSEALRPVLETGDIVVDGGNSHWADSQRRHAYFAEQGVHFLDIGTSGGLSGARHGACFMAGGDPEAYQVVAPLLKDLAVDDEGTIFVGPPGAGHFVKLVHNAIEFGMVQAVAEGVELLQHADYELDLPGLFNNWSHGSVIRSWLVELMGKALQEHTDLDELSTYVEDTGEVKWVLNWALEQDIPTPVVNASQTVLMQSRDQGSVTAKAVALLRNQYGGHLLHRTSERNAPNG